MLTELMCLVLVVVCVFIVLRKEKLKGKLINGPKGLPILGNILEINNETIHLKFMAYAQQFGEIFRLKMLSNNVIVLNSEQCIRKAFGGEQYKNDFGGRAAMFNGEHFRFHNQTLAFAAEGSSLFHRTARKTFVEALHTYGSGLQELEDNVKTEMANLIQTIKSKTESESEFECVAMLQRSLSNVLSLVLCGETFHDDDPDVNLFWDNVHANDVFLNTYNNFVMKTFPFLCFLPGKYGDNFRSAKRSYARIAQRLFFDMKKSYVPGKMRGIVDHYLAEQMSQANSDTEVFFTDGRIIAQIVETIDAGITTSWSALSNSMLVLLNYPKYQIKIQNELDKVIGRDRLPTYSDRKKCIFFQAFEMEVHRYLTVLPLMLPHICREHIEFEGYDIQANSTVFANVWYMHHDDKIWGDPWIFRPERFLDQQGDLLPKNHVLCKNLIAFGYGLRKCPGEIFAKTRYFLYIANLLQRWNFDFAPGKGRSCDPRKIENFEVQHIFRTKPCFCCANERQ